MRRTFSAAEANLASSSDLALRDAENRVGILSYSVHRSMGKLVVLFFDVTATLLGWDRLRFFTTIVKLNPIYVHTNLNLDDFLKYRQASSELVTC